MKKHNIAIVGNGYIAGKLRSYIERFCPEYSVITFGRKKENEVILDLNNAEQFRYDCLNNIDYIVFAAAISSPDACAQDYDSAYKVNVLGTSFFIEKALNYNCKIIFLSSDAVFGFAKEVVDENSCTVADTAYGAMKKIIEDKFKSNSNFKALRLSYVVSSEDKFSKYLKMCYQNGETAEIYSPFSRCCITMYELIEVIIYLTYHWNEFSSVFLNVCGKQLLSREELVSEWNKLYDGLLKYKIIKAPTTFFSNRPAILEMKSLYLQDILGDINCTYSQRFNNELTVTERMKNT